MIIILIIKQEDIDAAKKAFGLVDGKKVYTSVDTPAYCGVIAHAARRQFMDSSIREGEDGINIHGHYFSYSPELISQRDNFDMRYKFQPGEYVLILK